ncbi:trafficking protein particle complex subunit 8 isoform X2 [Impatiens glandulifera]|uniref:trafficking protein particle complex subunit 8 isoform X2 n=1 Tax=Impatiens glandulifera TaxID=253017 RepID=UPI001FB17267|nr:trafficking protein particle complex subunit 8 isoform X2 [Impatiens glandulifera]
MMDPANSPLGQMLLDQITPVVMVLRTDLVEESFQKNDLSLIETLSPFCNFSNIDVPVRTANDQPYRLHKFKLRLFYASDIRQPDIEAAKEQLRQTITNAGEKESSNLFSDPLQLETILTTPENDLMPAWFEFFNKELVQIVSFSDHEAFDYPVACLVVVSSNDKDPIKKFADLFSSDKLPSLLGNGAMDPRIPKHYVLLHDNQDGTQENAVKILAEMRTAFDSNYCRLLCINSSQEKLPVQQNLWPYNKANPSPGEAHACFLGPEDMDELRSMMHDLSSKHIIPQMEQTIRILNQQVSTTRRGFRNQIKNLWWRKGKDETEDNLNGPMYTPSSTESQIRVLGDYAFMLRDYELALSNYRLLSTDYKLDKAWKRYAGVQEMMGLSYFMLDQSRKDAEYCMETAFNTYLKIVVSGHRNATRCGIWWIEMLKTRDQYKEAATIYFRISGDEPLHSAVMLEQASYCYLFAKPPMLRKYGFHLVLSGDLYKKSDQVKHAIRTYRCALTVLRGTTWSHIRDHIYFHIGKWYAFLGLFDAAVEHMLEVLACSHQSKSTQELILRDFFQIVQKTGKTFNVPRLQLPVIDVTSLKVVFEDHRTFASPDAVSVKESIWQSMEEALVPSLSTTKTNWLNLQSKTISKKLKESSICVVGEPIKVVIRLSNPLFIPISISSVSLICKHLSSEETESDDKTSTNEQENDNFGQSETSGEPGSGNLPFTASEVDILLGEGETTEAELTVTPKVRGTLKVIGVRWKLSGSVVGYYNLENELARKKPKKRRGKSGQATGNNLEFLVIKSLPKLEGFIRNLPKTVYAGDIRHLSLVLTNTSEIPVKSLKVKISHPRFLIVGNREDMDVEYPACLEKNAGPGESDPPSKSNKTLDSVFVFPEDSKIYGTTPFLWPIWLRAAAPGKISLYITIYYETEDSSSIMRYRTLRMHHILEVLPSLDLSFQISPCPSRLQELLVRMDVVNRTSSQSFGFHQLSSVGNQWEINLLQPVDRIFPSETLYAGQALSCFFKLKDRRGPVDSKEISSSEKADVRLSQSSNKALFNISKSPLLDFHHHERMHHQQISDQDKSNAVDFILISLPQWNESGPNDPNEPDSSSILFSHHACHSSMNDASPICWLMEGPRTITHNFFSSSGSFCQIDLKMTINNSSTDGIASVHINTLDVNSNNTLDDAANSGSSTEGGWHDISLGLLNEANKVTSSDVLGTVGVGGEGKPLRECVPPILWSGTSSTLIKLEPMSRSEVPLQVCVFSPGTYDLSNYVLRWKILKSSSDAEGPSGTCQGYPYYLTVLQSS